jgi:diguanylate cyclase (GGDEF)-like protein
VVLLDAAMEREARTSMIGEIKSDPELFAIAIVLVGAHGDAAGALAAMERGAHDVLPDDADAFELAARVRAARRGSDMQELLLTRERELERLAYYDELTGLPNRRSVLRQLEALISRGRRHGHAMALLMVDADHFKAVNDLHGHAAGDAALRALAERLCERLRTEDVAGRFGGEEFVIALPDADAAGAVAVAEGVRAAVSARPLTIAGRELSLTVSVGWATWEDDDLGQLLARADGALYEAKAAGRDCVRPRADSAT